jgi:hypothetical protein
MTNDDDDDDDDDKSLSAIDGNPFSPNDAYIETNQTLQRASFCPLSF